MSGYEKIKERILDEAKLQSKVVIERAEAEAASIIRTAEEEADERKNKIIEKAKNEALEVRKRLIAMAELDIRKQKLKERHQIIEHAFEEALNKLCIMPDKEYQDILTSMILNTIESGNEEIVLSERDKSRLNNDFIDNVNEKINKNNKGITGNLKLSSDFANIRGGFVLKSGNIELNSSFETLIRMKRDQGQLESEIFDYLF